MVLRGKKMRLKVRSIGNSVGIVIPKQMMTRLGLKKGDTLLPTETQGGGYRVTRGDPDSEEQMNLAERL